MKSLSGRLRLRPYLSVFQMRFRVETQYRAAALGGVVTQGFFALILIALYRALYAAAPQAESLVHTVTYVWIQQMAFRLLFFLQGRSVCMVPASAGYHGRCRCMVGAAAWSVPLQG